MQSPLTIEMVHQFIKPIVGRPDDFLRKISEILLAILAAKKLRISSLAENMSGKYGANYRRVTRLLKEFDNPDDVLVRMLPVTPEYFIGDPSIIERPEADNTEYVDYVRPNKKGYYLFAIAAPFKGRALPVALHTYSPATFNRDGSSRNIEHENAFEKVKAIVGDAPIILDREFSYESLLSAFEAEEINFVIRLNKSNHVKLTDMNGNEVELSIGKGQTKTWKNLKYKNKIKINVAAKWDAKFQKPIFIMTSLDDAGYALNLYFQRMKIEMTFKDLKSYLGIDKNMSLKQGNAEKLMTLACLAYIMAMLIGENIRESFTEAKKKLAIVERTSSSFFTLNGIAG